MEQHLAAILYADVAGYSRLTGIDQEGTHQKLDKSLDLLTDIIAAHGGSKVHEAGDAILAEFRSATAAVRSALEFQGTMGNRNAREAEDKRLQFRVGINLGEVIHDRGDVYGDGVNVAARIQETAEPGGICISATVYEQVERKVSQAFDDLGFRKFKNIARSVHVYRARLADEPVQEGGRGRVDELNPFLPDALAKSSLITGACLCGEVRFEITQPAIGTSLCHCKMCQRSTSSAFAQWTVFRAEAVRFAQSEPTYYKSSLIGERGYCPGCGTRLTMRYYAPTPSEILAIMTASLDSPEDFAPTHHLGVESQLPWLDLHDDLPRQRSEDSPDLRQRWAAVGRPDPADWR